MPLKSEMLAWPPKVNFTAFSLLHVPPDKLVSGSPIPTSYHLAPEISSCRLVFSYQVPHSVYLNFNLISLTEKLGIHIPFLLPRTSFEMGLKRSV